MDWQAATLIGLGYIAGIVTSSLRQTTRQSDSVATTAIATNAVAPNNTSPPPAVQGTPPEHPKALAYERLSQLERFKSGFLARSAHELRSPINSVIGLHQLILEGLCETPDEEKQFTGEAKEAAYKVLQLFDTIIAASKLDIGREVPMLEPVALSTLFKTLQELTKLGWLKR
ncbi:MAG: histidine kinase dimerization/phospho-acceptor domain-containing protein [Cyanobacteria bacterium J06607_17]